MVMSPEKKPAIFIRQTIEAAKEERSILEEAYRRTGDIQIAARE